MKLLFILTFKGSLQKWKREGIVRRELEVCFEYLRKDMFTHIQIFTYSTKDQEILDELDFEPELKERIELIAPDSEPNGLFDSLKHSVSFSKLKGAVKSGAVISKTNQINGCWSAVIARILGCPMFLRCGYILSRRLFKNKHYPQGLVALALEVVSANLSSLISVTTQDAADYLKKFTIKGPKIFVAPTYVNTEIFEADIAQKKQERRLVFVGRLEPQKNVLALIEACKLADVSLTLIGQGSLEAEVLAKATDLGLDFEHLKNLQNEDIAKIFRESRYFILPSLHEGLPKVLIEAMAAEMICIGTPTSGTTDLIKEGKTGYLAKGYSPQEIAEAISTALDDENADSMARNARQHVLDNHSIDAYALREFEMIKSCI